MLYTTRVRSSIPASFFSWCLILFAVLLPSVANAQTGIWSVGKNDYGQLADGTSVNQNRFIAIGNLTNVIALSPGWQTYCPYWLALKSDGTVWAWGANDFGIMLVPNNGNDGLLAPVRIGSLNNVVAIAAGRGHNLALKSDGTVWAWGRGGNGTLGDGANSNRYIPVQVKGPGGTGFLTNIISIAAGNYHSVALKSDGTVWAWGYNNDGQLGDGSNTRRSTPVQVVGLSGVIAITAGDIYSLALTSDGIVWAWGDNSSGQLGDGTLVARNIPVPTLGLSNIVAISCISSYSMATRYDGTLWMWGSNGSGQLGDGTTIDRRVPVQVLDPNDPTGALSSVVHTARGLRTASSLAVRADGTVKAWGSNYLGALGISSLQPSQTSRPLTADISNAVIVEHGFFVTAILKSDGTVWTCGYNCHGPLGYGTHDDGDSHPTPAQATALSEVLSVACGGSHNLARNEENKLYAWGYNEFGQIGVGTFGVWETNRMTHHFAPVPVKAPNGNDFLTDVVAAAGGAYHSLAVKSDGTVYAFGQNLSGQLGDNTTTNRNLPTQVRGVGGTGFLTGVLAVAGGTTHSLALKSDGTVWGWGGNQFGQLGDNSSTQRNAPVQVKGANNVGTLTGVMAIASGAYHSLALKTDGTVWAWGGNASGQLGDGTFTTRRTPVQVKGVNGTGFLIGIVAIACGGSHNLALQSDGTLYAWGQNAFGQLGNNTSTNSNTPVRITTLTDVVAMAAGESHSLSLKSDGTVWAWGSNSSGQLGDGTLTDRNRPVQAVNLDDPSGFLTGMARVAAGGSHSLAMRPLSASLSGHITLAAYLRPIKQQMTIEFRPDDGSDTFVYKPYIGHDGAFRVSGLPRKNYSVWIKGRKWLAKVASADLRGGSVSNLNVTLLPGDANDDNSVDVLDLDLLIQAFDNIPGDYRWNEGADFNGDNTVDVLDLDILIQYFDNFGDA